MTCDHYLRQARNNEQAARNIKDDYPDWAITICFYAALHCVEYYACSKKCDIKSEYPAPSPHESRRDYIFDLGEQLGNRNLRKVYQDLEDESQRARYLKNISTDTKSYYTNNKKVNQSFQNLQQIKQILGI
jgi:hypothetical protein